MHNARKAKKATRKNPLVSMRQLRVSIRVFPGRSQADKFSQKTPLFLFGQRYRLAVVIIDISNPDAKA